MIPGGGLMAAPVNQMPDVQPQMMQADYWIHKLPDQGQSILMQPEQIAGFNAAIRVRLPDLVYDLAGYPHSITGSALQKMLDRPWPEDPLFIGADPVEPAYAVRLQRNVYLEGIKEDNAVQYAITVCRTNMRTYPASEPVSDEANDLEYDLFQETAIHPFEPVLLLHASRDGLFYYAQIYNYRGWIPAADVALCADKAAWLAYQKPDSFIVVAGNQVRLCQNPYTPAISELNLPMGTILPEALPEEVPAVLDGQDPTGNFVVKIPARRSDGTMELKLALLPVSADVSEGFMPYTRANVIRQAFKMQGDRYGWGGMLNGRDCSALIMDVYRCFGFALPRNAGDQALSAGTATSFEDYAREGRIDLMESIQPGASLHFPGHTMLYLGQVQGRFYVISALGSWARLQEGSQPQTIRVHSVVVNNLELTRRNGITWLDSLNMAVQYQ